MNDTTTTPPLPSGFARTARAFESLSDAEALPLIETAETNPDGEKRRVALSTLGRAGILPPLNWVPLARKVNVSPVYSVPVPLPDGPIVATGVFQAVPEPVQVIVPALAQAVKGCREGRQRHRYLPGGACKYCPARDPRKPQGKGSLADSIKANPITPAPTAADVPGAAACESSPNAGTSDRCVQAAKEEAAPQASSSPAQPPTPAPAESLKAEALPITTAVSFAEAMGELEAVLSPTLSGDDGYAAWVVGRILDRQAQIQRVEAQAREMVAQLHSDLSGLAYRFKAPLQEYARRLIEASGRKGSRSVKTLAGTLGFRGGEDCKPTLSIADPERLREWCLEQPDAEQFGAYTFVPDKAKVLAWAKATGEIPRGVEAKAQPESFFVKSADGVSVNLSKLSAPALPAPDEEGEE